MKLIWLSVYLFTAASDIFGESSTSRLGGLSAYCDQIDAAEPPRRFKSSLLGGEIPYGSGSQRFILTQAQRKEYPPTPPTITSSCEPPKTSDEGIVVQEPTSIIPEPQLINLTTQKKPDDGTEPAVVRCSVIQRVPSVPSSNSSSPAPATSSSSPSPPTVQTGRKEKPTPLVMHHKRQMAMFHRLQQAATSPAMMPEQEHPIDYHIPKKRDMAPSKRMDINGELVGCEEDEDKRIKKIDLIEEREKRIREAKRAILHRALLQHIRRMPPGSPLVGRLAGIVQAAAGHGRSSSNNSGGQSSASGSASSNGTSSGSINFSGSAGCGNSGAAGGLGGSGAGGNGRDNRSNYGPNSPPTGSLPPFYESLKGGANGGLNAYNAQNGMNGNAFNNYLLNSTLAQMDCDANGELTNIGGYPSSPQDANTKQYSVLQNVYLQNGMVLKDEIDLDYDGKIDTLSLNGNLLQNYSDGYTDAMMADLSNAVDPLQLTATLTFSSPNEHALLESLTDAVDLSQFLQRLPTDDDQCNDLELSSTPSLTPDSNGDHHQQHHNLDSFQDHLIGGGRHGGFSNDRQLFYKSSPPSSTSSYENPPPYQTRDHNGLHNSLLQQQHHQHLVQNGFDLDSSLPSPSGTSPYDSIHSPQQQHHHNGMPNVSEHRPSASTTPSPMQAIQNVSRSMKSNNRRVSAAKLSTLLASATSPEPPHVADAKVHVQRVSKFYWSQMEIDCETNLSFLFLFDFVEVFKKWKKNDFNISVKHRKFLLSRLVIDDDDNVRKMIV